MATELNILRQPDLEYDRLANMESESMLNRRSLQDEIAIVKKAGYLAIGGTCICLLSLILSSSLASHNAGQTFFWQSIMNGLSLAIFIYCVIWSRRSYNALRLAREPFPIQTTIAFQFGLFLSILYIVQMFWILMYRPQHYNYLRSLRASQPEWERRFGQGTEFASIWASDKFFLTMLAIFDGLIAFCFCYVAYAARSLHAQKYYLSRMALYTGLGILSFSSWMIIFFVQDTYKYESIILSDPTAGQNDMLNFYAILCIILAIANGIANLNRKKGAYLIFSMICFILTISVFSSTGLILHDAREAIIADIFTKSDCRTTMVSIHESNLQAICPVGGKYMPPGVTCKKEDLTYRWENKQPGEMRSLNPACCTVANIFYVRPYLYLSYWGLVTIFTLATITIFNIILMDYDGSRLWVGRVTRLLDFVSIGGMILMFFGFIIYFIARSSESKFQGSNPDVKSYIDPFQNQIANLPLVPESVKTAANSTLFGPRCFSWHADVYPSLSFDTASATCKTDCVTRVALLVKRGNIRVTYSANSRIGTASSKPVFFPGCTGSEDQYIYFWGSIEGIQDMIKSSTICPSSNLSPIIYIKQTQVASASVNTEGLTSEEKQKADALALNGPSTSCGDGFVEAASCKGDCSILFDTSKVGVLEVVKGRLYFQEKSSSTPYFNIPPTVKIEAFREEKKVGTTFSLFEGGLWGIEKIMRVYNFSYVMTLKISDSSNRFLPKEVDILVPPEDVFTTEFSAGNIRLLTPDGKICTDPAGNCPAAPKLQGTINVLISSEVGLRLAHVLVGIQPAYLQLLAGHRTNGEVVKQTRSYDMNGKAVLENLDYGAYTIIINKAGFLPSVTFVELQEGLLELPTINLKPVNTDHDMVVSAMMTDPNVDYDLMLKISNDQGYECTVSPLNKYCGYSMSQNDIVTGVGEEVILIKKLAVAEYMAYVAPAVPYDAKCKVGTDLDSSSKHYQAIDWRHVQTGIQGDGVSIVVNMEGMGDAPAVDASGIPIAGLRIPGPVETIDEANSRKRLISQDGAPVEANKEVLVSTNFAQGQVEPGAINFNEHSGGPEETELQEEPIDREGDTPATTEPVSITEAGITAFTDTELSEFANEPIDSSVVDGDTPSDEVDTPSSGTGDRQGNAVFEDTNQLEFVDQEEIDDELNKDKAHPGFTGSISEETEIELEDLGEETINADDDLEDFGEFEDEDTKFLEADDQQLIPVGEDFAEETVQPVPQEKPLPVEVSENLKPETTEAVTEEVSESTFNTKEGSKSAIVVPETIAAESTYAKSEVKSEDTIDLKDDKANLGDDEDFWNAAANPIDQESEETPQDGQTIPFSDDDIEKRRAFDDPYKDYNWQNFEKVDEESYTSINRWNSIKPIYTIPVKRLFSKDEFSKMDHMEITSSLSVKYNLEYPAVIPAELLEDVPDTVRLEDEAMDSEEFDKTLTDPANTGDPRAEIIANDRTRTTDADGTELMNDAIENYTKVDISKAYSSSYTVAATDNQITNDNTRKVEFFGETLLNEETVAVRNATLNLVEDPQTRHKRFEDLREFMMGPEYNVSHLYIHKHDNYPTSETKVEVTCIANNTAKQTRSVCNEEEQFKDDDGNKMLAIRSGESTFTVATGAGLEVQFNKTQSDFVNGTSKKIESLQKIVTMSEEPVSNYTEVHTTSGPDENGYIYSNITKFVDILGTGPGGMDRSFQTSLDITDKDSILIWHNLEKERASKQDDISTRVHEKKTIFLGESYDLHETNTTEEINIGDGSFSISTIFEVFRLEKNKNNTLTQIEDRHDLVREDANEEEQKIKKEFTKHEYTDLSLSTNNAKIQEISIETIESIKRKGVINETVDSSNQTTTVTFLEYPDMSSSRKYEQKVDSMSELNPGAGDDAMPMTGKMLTNNLTECDASKVCKTTATIVSSQEFDDANWIRNAYTAKSANNTVEAYESNTTTMSFVSEDGEEASEDSKITQANADGSYLVSKSFEQKKSKITDEEIMKSNTVVALIESFHTESSPILKLTNFTNMSSTVHDLPDAYKTSSEVKIYSTLMKDGTFKVTVNSLEQQFPTADSDYDMVNSMKRYMYTSLLDDPERPDGLKEYIEKNESSTFEYFSGTVLKKKIEHNETSKTDASYNETLEWHTITSQLANGSTITRNRRVVGIKVLANNTVLTKRNYSQIVTTGDKSDLSWSYTYIQVNSMDDNILLDSQIYPPKKLPPASHFGSDNSKGPRKRILQGTEIRTSDLNKQVGTFILVSCFTGFGKPSLVQMNQILKEAPTISNCKSHLKEQRPYFTLEALRAAYNEKRP